MTQLDPLKNLKETDTVYESPSLGEIASVRKALGLNLKKISRDIAKRHRGKTLAELFPNVRQQDQEFDEWFESLGTAIED